MCRFHLAIVLLAGLLLAGCQKQAPPSQPLRPVVVQRVQAVSAVMAARYTGTVHARFETWLSFRVPGKVVERAVDAGEHVEPDQLLARLDPSDEQLAVAAARTQVDAARQRHAQAKRQYQRAASLVDRGLVSRAEHDQRKAALDVAAAELKHARKTLATQQNRHGYTRLVADHAGIITEVQIDPGQVVAAGEPAIGFARGSKRELWVGLPESRLDTVAVGDSVTVDFWALPDVELTGRVREIAGDADPASGTYRVRIALADPPEGLHLGMSGTAHFQAGTAGQVVRLPLTSLYHAKGKPAVWVLDPAQDTLALQPVVVLRYTDDAVLLAAGDGLAPGMQVVTRGVNRLHVGQRVKPVAVARTAATASRAAD